jgi:hypothetical protein
MLNYLSMMSDPQLSETSVTADISQPVIGYKSFDPNWKCRDFQYEVGKTYELPEGQFPVLCETGFHFCRIPKYCDTYYDPKCQPKHALIHAWDVVDDKYGTKSVCWQIKIVREITSDEWGKMSGKFVSNGMTVYLTNNQLHRDDGPAIQFPGGIEMWYRNGVRHR